MVGNPYKGRGTGVFDKLSPDGPSTAPSTDPPIAPVNEKAALRPGGLPPTPNRSCYTTSCDPPEVGLKPAIFYRVASVLLLLFAALHTFGFRQVDPQWGLESLIGLMRSIHFDIMGTSRTYWDFFVGFGFFFSIFLVFTAVLAWQLGGLSRQSLAVMRGTAWTLVICFAAVTILAFRYAFVVPIVFSILILLCLAAAAWLSAKPA